MIRNNVANVWNRFTGKVKKFARTAPVKMDTMGEKNQSRRDVLRGALVVGCGLLAPSLFSAAANSASTPSTAKKVSQASVKYQSHSKDDKKCGQCVNFIAESNSCKLVEGKINPGGWCVLWAKKG